MLPRPIQRIAREPASAAPSACRVARHDHCDGGRYGSADEILGDRCLRGGRGRLPGRGVGSHTYRFRVRETSALPADLIVVVLVDHQRATPYRTSVSITKPDGDAAAACAEMPGTGLGPVWDQLNNRIDDIDVSLS